MEDRNMHLQFLLKRIVIVCSCFVAELCLNLCDPVDCSTPDSSVLLEFAQIYVH